MNVLTFFNATRCENVALRSGNVLEARWQPALHSRLQRSTAPLDAGLHSDNDDPGIRPTPQWLPHGCAVESAVVAEVTPGKTAISGVVNPVGVEVVIG